MTFLRVPLICSEPEPTEPERTARFHDVYEVCATFRIDCFTEAAHTLDRLNFAIYLVEAGRIGKGDRN